MSNSVAYMKGWSDAQLAASVRIKELESELMEQARIVGMGAERELKLMTEVERYRAALEKIASGWIDPVVGGDCKDCDMGLYQNLGHLPECVFEIAREALK